jgi:hypothetical protein
MACHVDLTTSEVAWEEKMRRDGGMCEGIYGSGCNHGICEFNVVEAHREDEKNTGDHRLLATSERRDRCGKERET